MATWTHLLLDLPSGTCEAGLIGFSRPCFMLLLTTVILVRLPRMSTLQNIFHIHMICQRLSKRLGRGRVFLCLPILQRKRRAQSSQRLASRDPGLLPLPGLKAYSSWRELPPLHSMSPSHTASLHASGATGSLLGSCLNLALW